MYLSDEDIESLFMKYSDMVYRICVLILKNESDAEDVLQDVFIKLIKYSHKIKDSEHLKAWIIRVSQNTCKDILRKHSNQKEISLDYIENSRDHCYLNKDNDIKEILDQLPLKYKVLLYLYYYEGYSYKDIANILKLPITTIRMRIRYAKNNLKILYEEHDYYE